MEEKLYTAVEIAEKTGRSKITVQKLAQRYSNIGFKVGKTWIFTEKDIELINQINRTGGRPRRKSKVKPILGPRVTA